MIWIVLLLMAIAAAAALLLPLRRRRTSTVARSAYDIEIYRDQLAELDRDVARGVVGAAEAKATRAEIGRRMLAAAAEGPPAPAQPVRPARVRLLTTMIAAFAPVAAFLLYLGVGSPGLPGMPFGERHAAATGDSDASRAKVAQLVATLAERLQQAPNDLEGWTLLARSLSSLERFADAVPAWRRVMELSNNAAVHAGPYGEAVVQAASGIVTPEARAAFERVLAADALDPRARFYIGLFHAQAGDARAALQAWTDVLATTPADAPWRPTVEARLRQTAAEAKIDPATITPSPEIMQAAAAARAAPRGPSAADIEAMQRLSPEERAKTIRGMVEGLEARLQSEPDDVDGWRRLGRAWGVLGERDKARAALAKAAALAPSRVDVLTDYAGALIETVGQQDPLPEEFVAVMRRVLAIDPEHGDALWFVGLAEAEAGQRDAAAALWQRLLDRLPPDSREHAEVKDRLDRLNAAN